MTERTDETVDEIMREEGHGRYQNLIDVAKKFVNKVESGRARSVETYREMKVALLEIEEASNGK